MPETQQAPASAILEADPTLLPKTPGYHTRLAATLGKNKIFSLHYKKGFRITSIEFPAPDWETANSLAQELCLKFGMRYISVRPAVFDIQELLILKDLPNYL